MAQNFPRRCQTCGTPAEADQRFCAECGTVLSSEGNKPTELASGDSFKPANTPNAPQAGANAQPQFDATVITPQNAPQSGSMPGAAPYSFGSPNSTVPTSGAQFYRQPTEYDVIAPPPPSSSYASLPPPSPAPMPAPVSSPAGGTYNVPSYAQAPRRSRGCLLVSIVLLLVLVGGGVGIYFGFIHNHGPQPNQNGTPTSQGTQTTGNTPTPGSSPTSGTTPTASNTPSSGGTSTTGGVTQVNLSLPFTYSSIDYTINSVQYSQGGYPDDTSVTSGAVRVAFSESNATSNSVVFGYNDVARLILPNSSTIPPANELHSTPPATQTTGVSNWFDFPVTTQPTDLTTLVLQMGTASENQMKIPLMPGANISQYQSVMASPNATFTYAGIQWTITKAALTYSAEGMQATSGNIFVTISLHAVNNTTQDFINNDFSYMRMKLGSVVNAPVDSGTFPNSISPQSTADGDVSFLMPQGNTSFTLVMLMQSTSPPIQSVSQNFQV